MDNDDFTRRPLGEGLECGSPPRGVPPVEGPAFHGQSLDLPGVTSRDQALRLARHYDPLRGGNPVDALEPLVRHVAARTGRTVDEAGLSAARAHCDELVPVYDPRESVPLRVFPGAIPAPLMALITALCVNVTETRPPNQHIGRTGNPYIDRWFMGRKITVPERSLPPGFEDCAPYVASEIENIYLHLYHPVDADEPHDHPWPNASLVVRGWYREDVYATDGARVGTFTRRVGDVVLRSSGAVHAILETSPDCLSLFGTLRKERDWGFHTADGFVPWREFDNRSSEAMTDGHDQGPDGPRASDEPGAVQEDGRIMTAPVGGMPGLPVGVGVLWVTLEQATQAEPHGWRRVAGTDNGELVQVAR